MDYRKVLDAIEGVLGPGPLVRVYLRTTIITSQLPRTEWHGALGDPTIADAILDRLVHNAHDVALTGPSQRGERTTPTKK